jgi:hypothetical protein
VRRPRRDERGASTVEMAMYMPILLLFIFATVQGALVYLGNEAASAVAREAARVARTNDGNEVEGSRAGYQYAANIGHGILIDPHITWVPVGPDRVKAVVTGHAQEISPVLVPEVSQSVEGPIEQFRQDVGP